MPRAEHPSAVRAGGNLAQRLLLRASARDPGEPGPDAPVGRVAPGLPGVWEPPLEGAPATRRPGDQPQTGGPPAANNRSSRIVVATKMPPFKSSLPRFPVFSPLSGVFGCKRTCSRRAFSWAGERRQRTLELRFALPPVATRNGLAQPTRIGAPRPWNGPLAPFAPWPNALQVGVHHDRRTVTLPKSTHFLPTKFLEYPKKSPNNWDFSEPARVD